MPIPSPPVSAAYRLPFTRYPGLLLVFFMLACFSFQSLAKSMYIVDKLMVGIHESKKRDSAISKVVPSDTKLEVLSTDDEFTRVKTEAGVTGWVDNSYLTEEKPARLVVKELEAWKKTRKQELAAAWEEVENLRQLLNEAKKQTTGSITSDDGGNDELTRLREENQGLKASLDTAEGQIRQLAGGASAEDIGLTQDQGSPFLSAAWHWVLLLALFLSGFAAGIWVLDANQRKRHGGFRV